jgi:uncharacterized 2Fe-2S/4Fe-4S cluster protein (DUF4445 family)
MQNILFLPFNTSIEIDGSKTILQLAQDARIPLQSTCGGKKKCGKCAVIIQETDGPFSPPSDWEKAVLGGKVKKGYRLACETRLRHAAVVAIPEESRITDLVILTQNTKDAVSPRIHPDINRIFVEVPSPALENVIADRERLMLALEKNHGIHRPAMDPFVLRKLPQALHHNEKEVAVTLRGKDEIIDLCAGKGDNLFGVAFDVGSTTVVCFLMDLKRGEKRSVKASMNPQVAFGDDIISRISFCVENPRGLEKLRSSIVLCLNELVSAAAKEVRIDPDQIVEAVMVGNTAMHHLLTGLDPHYLSMAPYAPVLQEAQDCKARDLGLRIGASAYVHLLPLKAGFVGGDTIACILATGLHESSIPTLLIDLGTNGEIVFGNKNRMLCCSTAAGPAFEGGHIRWGMRASNGAIEKVKIAPGTYDVSWETIHNEKPIGLCGSGIISAVAEMIRVGIILGRGNFDDELKTHRLREGEDGLEFVLVWAFEAATNQDIVITQKDVAELQMAKSAIHGGATLLMEEFQGEAVERILLAGAGGNYVDPEDACTIDLFPGCTTAKVTGVGNAAGHGACLALLDTNKRKEAGRITAKLEYRELAASTRFQELFVSGMFFTWARDFEDAF